RRSRPRTRAERPRLPGRARAGPAGASVSARAQATRRCRQFLSAHSWAGIIASLGPREKGLLGVAADRERAPADVHGRLCDLLVPEPLADGLEQIVDEVSRITLGGRDLDRPCLAVGMNLG